MSDTSQSLSYARGHGKYPVVFVPKRRRKALFGPMRTALGPSVHALPASRPAASWQAMSCQITCRGGSRCRPRLRWRR